MSLTFGYKRSVGLFTTWEDCNTFLSTGRISLYKNSKGSKWHFVYVSKILYHEMLTSCTLKTWNRSNGNRTVQNNSIFWSLSIPFLSKFLRRWWYLILSIFYLIFMIFSTIVKIYHLKSNFATLEFKLR